MKTWELHLLIANMWYLGVFLTPREEQILTLYLMGTIWMVTTIGLGLLDIYYLKKDVDRSEHKLKILEGLIDKKIHDMENV